MSDATPNVPDFPGNSQTGKNATPGRRKMAQVTTGAPIQRKKPLGKKIAETFTGDDARNVGGYVLFDVIIPAAKAMMSDAVSQGVERLLFGDVRNRNRSSRNGYTPYNTFSRRDGGGTRYDASRDEPRRSISNRGRATHDFDEIILESRGEAQDVLDNLTEAIDRYDTATVSDLYALVGITGNFTDDRWGWTSLIDASISRVREGYLLDLPKPQPLD